MKRILAILLLAVTVFFAGCQKIPETYTYKHNGKTLTVNTVEKTIRDGRHLYHYTLSEDNGITITYPDGSVYPDKTSATGMIIIGGEYGIEDTNSPYLSGWVLVNSLEKAVGKKSTFHVGYFLLGLILVGLGLFNYLYPETAICWRHYFWFKEPEPTDYAIWMTRISGIIAIISGAILVLISFLQ